MIFITEIKFADLVDRFFSLHVSLAEISYITHIEHTTRTSTATTTTTTEKARTANLNTIESNKFDTESVEICSSRLSVHCLIVGKEAIGSLKMLNSFVFVEMPVLSFLRQNRTD